MKIGNAPLIEAILHTTFWGDGGCVLFQTSGSTGQSKQVVLGKDALLVSARAVNDWLGIDADCVWGLALPLNHVGGFGVAARAYVAGCGFSDFVGKWDAGRFAEWIEAESVTHVSLVPTQIYDLLAAGLDAPLSLAAVVVGGGKLSDEAGQAARDKGWPVLASYGMTEACSQIATQSIELLDMPYVSAPLEVLPIWEVEESVEGLLRIKGEALFAGIIEEGVFRRREGAWFTTNDRVSVSGRALIPHGRADNLVKVMGELVDLEGVEKRFIEVARGVVREGGFAVVALPDARRENALVAVFEGEGQPECVEDYNRAVPGIERITGWVVVGEIPRTELGKIRRGRLAEICARSPVM